MWIKYPVTQSNEVSSQFVGQETLMSAFVDLRPGFFKRPWRKEIFLAFLSLTQFVIGLAMVTNVSINKVVIDELHASEN